MSPNCITAFSPDGVQRQWNTGQVQKKVMKRFTHYRFTLKAKAEIDFLK